VGVNKFQSAGNNSTPLFKIDDNIRTLQIGKLASLRAGRDSFPSPINFCSVRATSSMVTQPLALSLAPGL